jgi:MFS family permease
MTVASAPTSTFGPLRAPLFRSLWIASIASNLGSMMHSVGAAWLMTSITTSAATIALLQTASALPTFLLALHAGALTDVVDRRRLLLVSQWWMAITAGVLAVLTFLELATVPVVLGLTFSLGVGVALNQPVWSAIVPELVERSDLAQALVLNGLAFTGALAIGPALGGIVVAAAGPDAVFAINAVSFLGQIWVIWRWRRVPTATTLPAEHVTGAIRAGVRYLRFAPALQAVLVRSGAYVFGIAAMFALLPVVGRSELHLGAGGYGILLGCQGAGAVAGGFVLPRLRRRLDTDSIAAIGTVGMAATLAAVALVRTPAVLYPILVVGGIAQLAMMSSLNLSTQVALPAWVRGRGLALSTLVFQAAIAVGAIFWGVVAAKASLAVALLAAGAYLVATVALARSFPLDRAAALDTTPMHWPEPQVTVEPDADDGPILVTSEYRIDAADADAFAHAMLALRRQRRRDGAMKWGVWYDLDDPTRHVESYIVASWGEHLRQRDRSTLSDREPWQVVRAFHRGDEGVKVRWHLLRRAAHERSR